MNPAATNRQSAAAIINALVTAVRNIRLADNVTAAFDRVEYFDVAQLAEAFDFLMITEQRVCVAVPLEEKFTAIVNQPKLLVKRELPVLLMISDRVLGASRREVALLGDDTTPGARGLLELVLPAVTGLLLPNPGGVLCVPETCSDMNISKKDQAELPGRVAVALDLLCTGGTLETNVGPSPVL